MMISSSSGQLGACETQGRCVFVLVLIIAAADARYVAVQGIINI